jgi:hypothetical protein
MPTPLTSATAYCDGPTFVIFHDWRTAGDLLVDDDTRLADATAVASSATLATLLLAASGEVEAACLVSGRYTPDDLNALTGSTQAFLQKLVADLAYWRMMQRRWPDADVANVPGAKSALEMLDRLRLGERIFGLQEVADAGLAEEVEMAPAGSAYEQNRVSVEANRFFGARFSER